jgi:hypothetical protein
MEPLLGRTVSHIKNRFYQNLKDRDLSEIVYEEDEEVYKNNFCKNEQVCDDI